MDWQLADAKNRFSELVNKALAVGPQFVTRRKDRVVILSQQDYDRLTGKRPSFSTFLLQEDGPSLEGVDLTRDTSPMRDTEW